MLNKDGSEGDGVDHDDQCEWASEACGCASRIRLRAEIERLKRDCDEWEIAALRWQVANWERKEIGRASDCHGQEQRAERAEQRVKELEEEVGMLDRDLLDARNRIVELAREVFNLEEEAKEEW